MIGRGFMHSGLGNLKIKIFLKQAKKRAAWREARLKSLEQDAMQAEMVIKRMNELSDTSLRSTGSNTSGTGERQIGDEDNNANNNRTELDYGNNNDVILSLKCRFLKFLN